MPRLVISVLRILIDNTHTNFGSYTFTVCLKSRLKIYLDQKRSQSHQPSTQTRICFDFFGLSLAPFAISPTSLLDAMVGGVCCMQTTDADCCGQVVIGHKGQGRIRSALATLAR